MGAGSVCHLAAQKLIEHGRSLAALELAVEPSQVEYAQGVFRSTESKRTLKLGDIARAKPVSVVAEVEVDPDTGATTVERYIAVDDCGTVLNHTLVEGQIHGGLAQGAGQVFGEHGVYDRTSGQWLTGSFMDYYMPRAGLMPAVEAIEHSTVSPTNFLGAKGTGEAGTTGALPTLMNAVVDALRSQGVSHLDMPATPARVWAALQGYASPSTPG